MDICCHNLEFPMLEHLFLLNFGKKVERNCLLNYSFYTIRKRGMTHMVDTAKKQNEKLFGVQ